MILKEAKILYKLKIELRYSLIQYSFLKKGPESEIHNTSCNCSLDTGDGDLHLRSS